MEDIVKYDQQTDIQKYQGVPRVTNYRERTHWQRFIAFLLPWLNYKRLLGERYLEATVEKIEAETAKVKAEAVNQLAEAALKVEQMKDITRKATQIEQEKYVEISSKPITDNDVAVKIQELEDQIKYLSAVYGTKIEIQVKKNGE